MKEIYTGVSYTFEGKLYEVTDAWVQMKFERDAWVDAVSYREVSEFGDLVGQTLVQPRATFKALFKEI